MSSFCAGVLDSYQRSECSENHIECTIGNEYASNSLSPLLEEYKKTVINSIVTAFSLDNFFFKDVDGGSVQTMRNAKSGVYANDMFKMRGEREYNRDDYASSNDMNAKRKHDFKTKENICDGYKGSECPKDAHGRYDGRTHLEHIVSAKESHDNVEFRVLFSKDEMREIINDDSNTTYTDSSLNQSKGDKPLTEWMNKQKKGCEQKNAERFGVDRKQATAMDKKARKVINEQLARKKLEHYASSMTQDCLKQGGAMAVRQALGVVLTEVSITVFDEIPSAYLAVKANFTAEAFFTRITYIVKKAFSRVRKKMGAVWEAFQGGALSGVMSSLVTTIVNMFKTTGKNIVRIIRQTMSSVTEAVKTLFFDRDGRSPGERLLAATRILLVGAATVLGVVTEQALNEILETSGLAAIPYIGGVFVEGVSSFAGILLTGLLSVTLVYFLDHAKIVKKIIAFIDKIFVDGIVRASKKWEEANRLLDAYVASLCEIDVLALRSEVRRLNLLAQALMRGETSEVYAYCQASGIALQFSNTDEFNAFMSNESSVLEI